MLVDIYNGYARLEYIKVHEWNQKFIAENCKNDHWTNQLHFHFLTILSAALFSHFSLSFLYMFFLNFIYINNIQN